MAYIKANTQTSNGWRPGTVRLGSMNHPAARQPNWKVGAARLSRKFAIAHARAEVAKKGAAAHAARQDALVRRDRTTLSGLGLLDLGTAMVKGAQYIFHFTYSSVVADFLASSITSKITGDSNFISPVASAEGTGFKVQFVYNGQGSSVGAAGAEMQNVLNSPSIFSLTQAGVGSTFSYAEGGPVAAPVSGLQLYGTDSSGNPVYIDSEGNVSDAAGNVLTDLSTITPISPLGAGSPPGPGGPGAPFNFSNFFAGLGTGGALAIGGGLLFIFLLRD